MTTRRPAKSTSARQSGTTPARKKATTPRKPAAQQAAPQASQVGAAPADNAPGQDVPPQLPEPTQPPAEETNPVPAPADAPVPGPTKPEKRFADEVAQVVAQAYQAPIGRIPHQEVGPVVDGGARPSKSVVGEPFNVTATVFREGHDACNATAVLTAPDGTETAFPMRCVNEGLNSWVASVVADREGMWSFRVESWSDPFGTWDHDATIKIEAGVDTELMLEEGARIFERALETDRPAKKADLLRAAIITMRNDELPADVRLKVATASSVRAEMSTRPVRDLVSVSDSFRLLVERKRALYGAWYEIFPRSEGARRDPETGTWTTGTLRTAAERLPGIAAMGFDVVYLTPVHPIGSTNRKGRNNTLNAEELDPGSPYAIGSQDGGHDAIHPELGTFEDFDHFVAQAKEAGLEVALDIALQCSPDHPWVKEHPEWFTTRADGTIAYAENPPKKYQDIYPLNFDNDPEGIYREVRRVIQVWLDHGVRLFRVDNPHTKPVEFWQWIIADVARDHPDTIWLAEAFTKPAMMHTLAKVGYQQSYTYYAWRNEAWEIREYMHDLVESAHYMRPSFWPTTHDILTPFMQFGGPTAFKLRAALAATLSPTYGIYAGYELAEHVARPGAEEHIDNEKYEFKDRAWHLYEEGGEREGQSLAPYLTRINEIRRQHPALHWLRNIVFHTADDPSVLVFSKRYVSPDGQEDTVLVVAGTDPLSTRETTVHLDLAALGLTPGQTFVARDEITGASWSWGEHNFVRVGRDTEPIHVISVRAF